MKTFIYRRIRGLVLISSLSALLALSVAPALGWRQSAKSMKPEKRQRGFSRLSFKATG